MDELTRVACAMGYTDLRRRLIKAYRAHSTDLDPNAEGDPRLEDKLTAKLRSYGPAGFKMLLIELSEDLPDMHPAARRDLAEYTVRLREGIQPAPVFSHIFINGGTSHVVNTTGSTEYVLTADQAKHLGAA